VNDDVVLPATPPLSSAAPDTISQADAALLALDPAAARASLSGAGERADSVLALAIEDAIDALEQDDPAAAVVFVDRALAGSWPLPGVLRVCADALRRAGRYDRALDCLMRLELLGHDVLKDFLESLPPELAPRFLPLVRHVFDMRPIANLYLMQQVKNLLPRVLPAADIDSVFVRLFDLPSTPSRSLPFETVSDFIGRCGAPQRIVIKAQPFALLEPRRVGEPPVKTATLKGRTMFMTRLDDALVVGRSSFIWMSDRALIDAQGSELHDVVPSLNVDPLVMRRGESSITALPAPQRRMRRMGRAFHLVGWSTNFFGHWLTEYLPKLMPLLADERMAGMPILVDEGMPEQHHEALALLVGDRHPVVRIPTWGSIQVRKLWWCSTAMYVPMLPRLGQDLDATHMSAPPGPFAELIARMGERMSAALGALRTGRRVFLARGPGRRRKMTNRAPIEALAQRWGFEIVHPEKLGFVDQLRLAREADFILGPEGSGLMLAYFARKGCRLGILNHEFLENLATMTSTFEALGVETSIIYGRCTRVDENRRYSDYIIDPETVEHLFSTWGLQPPAVAEEAP